MKRVGILLITVTLVAGMVSCVQPVPFHDLTATSTAGGSIAMPGEGTFMYDQGTVVNLVAEVEEGYKFVNSGLVM
jgi:hypothetical protein